MFEKSNFEYYKNHKLKTAIHTDLGTAYAAYVTKLGLTRKLRQYQKMEVKLVEEGGKLPYMIARVDAIGGWGKINPRYIVFLDGSLSDKEGWDVMNDIIKKHKAKKK